MALNFPPYLDSSNQVPCLSIVRDLLLSQLSFCRGQTQSQQGLYMQFFRLMLIPIFMLIFASFNHRNRLSSNSYQ
ncbi:uncharacterized protein L3040_002369 [Drepanopeziza brunnea f. sp. 'multigermtubi']|uniref:uncharacterized protein n=1 Tax=Drepanopeziza brunnea f. sp. 'multigermtubi' TaxID=698441 RepID=UPI00238E76EB|nr:hypothetical protein L3040_002369 [Drepanopeziza brunnea f. sp. 'multigermtubi']